MQNNNIAVLQKYLEEDLLLLKNYGVKRLGFDPLSSMAGNPFVLVEFQRPDLGKDIRRLRDVTYLLMQTLGPKMSINIYPSTSTESYTNIRWLD